MDDEALLRRIDADVRIMLAAAGRAGWDAAVPGVDWDVRAVVIHTSAVHRWCADIVRRALATNESGGSVAFVSDGLDDDALPDWVAVGARELLETFRAAPDDLACFTFLRQDPPRRTWIRRQAHETAIHRADVEAAAGAITPFDPEFAQDGLHELVGGFARGRPFAARRPGVLVLAASDGPSWRVEFGGERNVITQVDADVPSADASVRGTSSELYLWAWNRPSSALEAGDADVLACWQRIRI